MKIVYISDALAIWGGLERVLTDKVNYLADEYGYEIHLLTANQGHHPIPYSMSSKVHHHDLDVRFQQQYKFNVIRRLLLRRRLRRLFVDRLRAYLQAVQPHVVVSLRLELMSAIAEAKGGVPLVLESHSIRYAERFNHVNKFEQLKTWWYCRAARHAQMIVALTEGDANDWRGINKHVCVIPNVVHLNQGAMSKCDSKSVIFVGRFSHQKDIYSMVLIWKLVHRQRPDWRLDVYGGYGEEKDELLKMIEEADANIFVHEPVSDIFEKYRESSILILTSSFEPFGLVLPEAMSCGVPVVAFDCPFGPSEIITDGVDGFIIKKRNIPLFAHRICHLIDAHDLRLSMGQAGIQSSQRYQAERIMPRWKELFTQLSSSV